MPGSSAPRSGPSPARHTVAPSAASSRHARTSTPTPFSGTSLPTYRTTGPSGGRPEALRHPVTSSRETSRPNRSASTAWGATSTLRSLPR